MHQGICVLYLAGVCNQWRTPEGDQWQGENWVGVIYFSGFLSARWFFEVNWWSHKKKKSHPPWESPLYPTCPLCLCFDVCSIPLFCLDNISILFFTLNPHQISQFNYVVCFLDTGKYLECTSNWLWKSSWQLRFNSKYIGTLFLHIYKIPIFNFNPNKMCFKSWRSGIKGRPFIFLLYEMFWVA